MNAARFLTICSTYHCSEMWQKNAALDVGTFAEARHSVMKGYQHVDTF